MLKIFVSFGLLLVVGINAVEVQNILKQLKVEFVSGKQLEDLLTQYPDAVQLTRNTSINKAGQSRVFVVYTLGNRVSGDFSITRYEDANSWLALHDAKITVSYPRTGGDGYIVTHVSIDVSQSNDSGRAYVIGGGIGQRHITFVVEAESTNCFNYDIWIYGRNEISK